MSVCGQAESIARAGLRSEIQHEYEYDAIETCAVDGTCADVCPIGINTGALMKHFRKMEHGVGAEEIALDVAMKWGEVERLARVGVVTRIEGRAQHKYGGHSEHILRRVLAVGTNVPAHCLDYRPGGSFAFM